MKRVIKVKPNVKISSKALSKLNIIVIWTK